VKSSWRGPVLEWIQSIGGAVVAALLIITFVGQSFVVEGSSMLPNLRDGERLLVEKITYRFREPARGEVVVFRHPGDPSKRLIKRVIGLPGDTIAIAQGRVYVNGVALEEDYINGPMVRWQTVGPLVVPADHYFLMGDNRNASLDSRDPSLGFVAKSQIVGRAIVRYWPLPRVAAVEAFSGMPAQ